MILTLTTNHVPATDLGYLLHKNPGAVQTEELPFGRVYLFYPEATAERCTFALLLEVDPVGLVRGRGPRGDGGFDQYVNDRPYVASSFLSVALTRTLRSAMAGTSRERQALADAAIPLEAKLSGVPCRGGEAMLRRLFEPLGYRVGVIQHPLDETFPEWGPSIYHTVTLSAACRLRDLLAHLYVLVPVLDDAKHYFVGNAEVAKLLRHGEGWLATHPERELIARRYLKHQRSLAREALAQLLREEEPEPADEEVEARPATEEEALERAVSLNEQRLGTVVSAVLASGARTVLDLGCGEGKLLRVLLKERSLERIVGLDVSHRALEIAAERLRLANMPEMQKKRIELLHGALTYRDRRLEGFDAAAVVEVVEHLDPPRLAAFERVLFEVAKPGTVVLTTPNREYNALFPTLAPGAFRHRDHRFEWTRAEFSAWGHLVGERHGYAVRFLPVGPEHPESGAPTQMAVFTRTAGTAGSGA